MNSDRQGRKYTLKLKGKSIYSRGGETVPNGTIFSRSFFFFLKISFHACVILWDFPLCLTITLYIFSSSSCSFVSGIIPLGPASP